MKNATFNCLGLSLILSVPDSVAEYDSLAKKDGAALESAIANTAYRGALADAREAFTERLAASTGIARKTKTTGRKVKTMEKQADGIEVEVESDGVAFAESEAEYVKRVLAELATERNVPEVPITDFQSIMADLSAGGSAEVKFDPSERERKPAGPKKLPAEYLAAGTNVISGTDPRDGQPILPKWQAKHGATAADGSDWIAESIGWKIRELKLAEDAAKKAQLGTQFV